MSGSIQQVPPEDDLDYLLLCGDEAVWWLGEVRKFRRLYFEEHNIPEILTLFRHHKLTEGWRRLEQFASLIPKAGMIDPSMAYLMERRYFTARAYAYYLEGDLEGAKRDLERAHDRIVDILNLHAFLMPFAAHCVDFMIQRARIARREHRWLEVKQRLDRIHSIYLENGSYCVLHSGQEIGVAELGAFFRRLPLSAEQRYKRRRWIEERDLAKERENAAALDELVFNIPDQVIPYP